MLNILRMKQKVALVLSGGGARGIAHIGVIEELEKRGYEITSIAGTSMGSLVGGIYALGKMDEFKHWFYSLDRRKVFNLVDFTISASGLVKGDKVFKEMKAFIPDSNIEDLRIPYAAIAAEILSKKEVVFTEGSLFHAIRASVAIPTVLTPVEIENGILVDGGVLNNIPIDHVQRTEGDILIAVNVNAGIPVEKPALSQKKSEAIESQYQKRTEEFYKRLHRARPRRKGPKLRYFNLISKTLELMTWRIDQLMLENHSPDMLIEISRDSATLFDFYKAEELVELGRHAAIMEFAKASKYPETNESTLTAE